MTQRENGASSSPVPQWHRLHQLPEDSVLARYGDLTLLCTAIRDRRCVGVLFEALAAAAESQADGRELSRWLSCLLSVSGPEGCLPTLCAFGPVDGGLAALVHGQAQLILTVDGQEVRLDGRDAVTAVDRMITEPVESIRAVIGDRHVDLGAVAARRPDAAAPPSDPPCSAEPPRVPDTSCLPGPEVLGVHCRNGHFNDPQVTYCTACGIALALSSGEPVYGLRPPLGVLVLDDGTVRALTHDQVVGRVPEADGAVRAGEASPLPLVHPRISRLHARVELGEWQVAVVDTHSANGTFLLSDDHQAWLRLEPGVITPIEPGAVVAFGPRQVQYCSYRSRR